jgi:hypothetical protein
MLDNVDGAPILQFLKTPFFTRLVENSLHIPVEKPLTNTENPPLPHVLVENEGSGVSSKLLRPFGRKNITVKKKVLSIV